MGARRETIMRHVIALLGALAVLSTTSLARAEMLKVPGMYSSMHYIKESGDVIGIEVFVATSTDGYYVMFQSSEGEPSCPVLVKARVVGNEIEFTLPSGSAYSGKVTAAITKKGLLGRFESGALAPDGKQEFLLERRPSYWQ